MEKLDENKLRYELFELSLELKLLKDKLNVQAYDERNDLIDEYINNADFLSLTSIKRILKKEIRISKIMLTEEGE